MKENLKNLRNKHTFTDLVMRQAHPGCLVQRPEQLDVPCVGVVLLRHRGRRTKNFSVVDRHQQMLPHFPGLLQPPLPEVFVDVPRYFTFEPGVAIVPRLTGPAHRKRGARNASLVEIVLE